MLAARFAKQRVGSPLRRPFSVRKGAESQVESGQDETIPFRKLREESMQRLTSVVI